MARQNFKLSHSIVGNVGLVFGEWLLLALLPAEFSVPVILACAAVGAVANIYVATEVIEEVRSPGHMLGLLSGVLAEFLVFFTFQFWFLVMVEPQSFPTLAQDAVSLLLHSTMVFVFNPLYLPATFAGRALLLIDTFGSLGLVLFILQNIWQIRHKQS
jgi:hypothetical protein